MANLQKIIIYVDGFNFYNGLKAKKWRKYYWLDIVGFFESFMREHQQLETVYYFSAKPLDDDAQRKRQQAFFSANLLNPKFKLVLGKYKRKQIKLKGGGVHETFEEKETDVRIATQMISDVVSNNCDLSILVSADSDLIPPMEFIKTYKPLHKLVVYFPPCRITTELKHKSDHFYMLERYEYKFAENMLEDEIVHPNKFVIKRPNHWR